MQQQLARCVAPDGSEIAYATVGEGPALVFSAWWVSHLEVDWLADDYRAFFETLAQRHTVVRYDRPGVGLSVRERTAFTLDSEVQYLRAVVDALDVDSVDLWGCSCGGPATVALAVQEPDLVDHVVLFGSYERGSLLAPTDLRTALSDLVRASWGLGSQTLSQLFIPDAETDEMRTFAATQRATSSSETAADLLDLTYTLDISDITPDVDVATQVLHRGEDQLVRSRLGRRLADRIAGAEYVELDGGAHLPWAGDTGRLLQAAERFLTGAGPVAPPKRVLATVLFTDIVGSTQLAGELGDRRWRELLDRHDELSAGAIAGAGGRLIKTTGDGVLAVFDSPDSALRCAEMLRVRVRDLDIQIRAGAHVGEVELRGGDVAGVAVNLAARVADAAEVDEILVTGTVRDLLAGGDHRFTTRGTMSFAGFDETWSVFALGDDRPRPDVVRRRFTRQGSSWAVQFRDGVSEVPHRKGMTDLATLLARPNVEISAIELVGGTEAPAPGGADPVLDDEAVQRYWARLSEIDEQLDAADGSGDSGQSDVLIGEREAVLSELRSASGLGGRTRRLGDERERARKAVSARIRDAISRINVADSQLGAHLSESVSTGTSCVYAPSEQIDWEI